ncbi:recombination-associated protein RdgC [Maridesulfovibrio bastinii]|uniref:recombination-associated protein RdgC n=1 Tax=Maridesulfovibrio bastinii TaxID=47157 RepID=UPI00041021AA|nr:recombination-associated protein RdgC [Maridesulfovibrio bastinii]
MGRLFKKHPLTIYKVTTPEQTSLLSDERLYDQLQRAKFETIDHEVIERTYGAVTIENYRDPWFGPENTEFGEYFVFSIRIDERKIPGPALKRFVEDAIDNEMELAKKEGRNFISRGRKREVKEQVTLKLRAKAVPTPTVADVWWNMNTGLLFLTDRSKAIKEAFEDTFKRAFGTVYELEELTLGINEKFDVFGHAFLTWIWNEGTIHIPYHDHDISVFIEDKVHAADSQEVLKAEQVKGRDADFNDIKRAVEEDGKMIVRAMLRFESEERFIADIEVDSMLTPFLSISIDTVTHHDEEEFAGALVTQIGNIEEAYNLFLRVLHLYELEQSEKETPDANIKRAKADLEELKKRGEIIKRVQEGARQAAKDLKDSLPEGTTMTIVTSEGEKVEVA